MRRSIDSEYIRKRRHNRRAKDNWRKIKRTKTMTKESNILYIAAALFLMWLCFTGIMISMAWQ